MISSFVTRILSGLSLCAALLGAHTALAQFQTHNTTLLSHIDLAGFPSRPASGNDCWGYVSPSGREYALMCVSTALAVVEITNPSNPVIIAEIPHNTSLWGDVKVYRDHCYVSNESGGGIQVISLADVDNGNVTLVRSLTNNGLSTAHNVYVDTDSGFLYVIGANINGGSAVVFDLAIPSNPALAGMIPGPYTHDLQAVTFTSGQYAGRQIAYCCNGSTAFDIVDVTNKASMFRVGRIVYPGLNYCHQGWLSADRRYFYVDDEFDEVKGRDQTTTHIFDVSDPANPMYVGWGTSGLPASDHNLYWHQERLYQANYHSGLQVLDAADPTNLARVAWFDTHPETDKAGFGGSWSCFPFFDSGSVLISDMGRGLFVVKLGEPCAADFNGDGEVNTLDVAAFLNAWAADDAGADINGDGEVNTLDVAAFLNAWTAGC